MSTVGQSLEVQRSKLAAHGCDKLFEEKKSGASRDEREALRQALTFIREGDQFIVTRLDRLARSVLDLSQITAEIAAKKVDLVVLDQAIDTGSPTGRLLFHMLAAIGEFERDLVKERAAEGIARAKVAGVKFGAKPKLSVEQLLALRTDFAQGTVRGELAHRFRIGRATVYRLCSGAKILSVAPGLSEHENAAPVFIAQVKVRRWLSSWGERECEPAPEAHLAI